MEMTQVAPGERDVELLRAMSHRIDQQDPGAFNNLGVLYHSKGLYAESVAAFLRALALDPRMRTAARNLEIAATHEGACDGQLAALTAQLNGAPDDADIRRDRARLLRLLGRHAEASHELETLIAADPDDAASLFERGQIDQRAGEMRKAQRWFERAVNAAPDDPMPRLHLAEVLYQRGQNEQALETLDELLFQCPTIAEAHLLCGFVLGDMGRHEAARAAAEHAASLKPALQVLQPDLSLEVNPVAVPQSPDHPGLSAEGASARCALGMAFRQRGYFHEARREFERALAHGEDGRLATHAIAELDIIDGRSNAACAAYDALLHETPDVPRFWNERGVSLHQRGAIDEAADSYRRALRADPRYALAYNNLGVALSDLGEASASREMLQRASDLDPTLGRARLNLARWHMRHRDPLAALTLLREIVAFQAHDADAWYTLGAVLLALHRTGEAAPALERAIAVRGAHEDAQLALAQLTASDADRSGALRDTQDALGLAPHVIVLRLSIGIDLQQDCPDAVGMLDLLAIPQSAEDGALRERVIDARSAGGVGGLSESGGEARTVHECIALAMSLCDEGDALAAALSYERAIEKYATASTLVAETRLPGDDSALVRGAEAGGVVAAVRKRALLGEARLRCLSGTGATSLGALRTLATTDADDPEVIALLAVSASQAASIGVTSPTVGPILMRRLLHMPIASAALLHMVGDTAAHLGETVLAITLFRRALAIDPTRPSPRIAIARLLREGGNLHAARLEALATLAIIPDHRDAVLEFARICIASNEPNDAMRPLANHLAVLPTDIAALELFLTAAMKLERFYEARVVAQRILRHDPENPAALWFAGVLLARQSRMRDAIERWQRVRDGGEYSSRAHRALNRIAEGGVITPTARMAS